MCSSSWDDAFPQGLAFCRGEPYQQKGMERSGCELAFSFPVLKENPEGLCSHRGSWVGVFGLVFVWCGVFCLREESSLLITN